MSITVLAVPDGSEIPLDVLASILTRSSGCDITAASSIGRELSVIALDLVLARADLLREEGAPPVVEVLRGAAGLVAPDYSVLTLMQIPYPVTCL